MLPRPSESAASSLQKPPARGKRSATPRSSHRSVPRTCTGFCLRSCYRCGSRTTWTPRPLTFRTRVRTAFTSTSTYPLRMVSDKKRKPKLLHETQKAINLVSQLSFAFRKGQNKGQRKTEKPFGASEQRVLLSDALNYICAHTPGL